MKRKLIFSTLALTFLSSAALAAPGESGPGHHCGGFAHMDINKDGTVTREEANQARTEHFARLDRNRDGQVSMDEMEAGMRQRLAQRFKRLDANNDGRLSPEELAARSQAHFAKADRNGDGAVTREELRALRPAAQHR
ncbi:MAG: EF-hand domain-containing protein [Pseudomonadota bacterium]